MLYWKAVDFFFEQISFHLSFLGVLVSCIVQGMFFCDIGNISPCRLLCKLALVELSALR